MLTVFSALRGGGPSSWGVVISATFLTFPTFYAVHHHVTIVVNSTQDMSTLTTLHANHIFNMDPLHPGQYFYWTATPPNFTWSIDTVFPNTTVAVVNATLTPFVGAVSAFGFPFEMAITTSNINNLLTSASPDDNGGVNKILRSRLCSDDIYHQNATVIGAAYKVLFDGGAVG
jgi:hypothetical protein